MKNLIALSIIFLFTSCSSLKQTSFEPTQLETISAVKEVLNSSAFRAIKNLRKLDQDGIAGFLPPELEPVLQSLKALGLEKEISNVEGKIGNVSKVIANESSGIMEDAIKEVKFKDAVAIVVGGKSEATNVLKEAMYGAVKNRYSSLLQTELEKAEVTQYWPLAANAYNMFAKKKVDNSMSDFMAERAVDVLFLTMGQEESKIRKDPKKLGKAVVTKVFDYYQKKKG